MIDKIVFYIKDVDLDALEKRIPDIDSIGYDKIRDVDIRGTTLRDAITIKVDGAYKLKGYGSLHKFAKGNNYSPFTINEAKKAIIDLGELIGIPLDKFVVTNIEFAVNMQMGKDPMQYINTIKYYRVYSFIYMKSLYKSSKLKGKVCKFTDYEIKFYDKTFEATHRNTPLKGIVPVNILRYEIACSRKKLKQLGLKNVTAEKLCLDKSLHYAKFKKELQRTLDKIKFHDMALDYAKKMPDGEKLDDNTIKNYIFAMSEDYDFYLDYIKAIKGEKEYKKEKKAKNALIKKMQPFVTNEHINELKFKFAEAIKLISDKKISKE
ncbi:MAG: hypothetical protein LBS20_16050 [Prevotella sp.]|jgi:hypothetical protein|nr:hypothetical protein [Prevotella sp.]